MTKTYSAYVRVQVTEGYELACPDLRVPRKDEYIADQRDGDATKISFDWTRERSNYRVIIQPTVTNAPRKAYVEFDLPPGYELAEPRMRRPKAGDIFLGGLGEATRAGADFSACYPILRKVTEPAESPASSFQNSGEQMSSPATAPEKNLQPVLVEIPAGYELACPQMRSPKAGENYLTLGGENREVGRALGDWGSSRQHHRVIVRPVWKWPEWLTAAAIAMDAPDSITGSGSWWAYSEVPKMFERTWSSVGGEEHLDNGLFRFDPPPCDDWTKSLRLNPNLNR